MTNFFGPGSPYLDHPLLTRERTRREVDRVLSWCVTTPVDILDMGCGFGRHCIEFARRGFAVTGVDPSAALLEQARQKSTIDGLVIDYVESGGEAFDRPNSFDLAISLFTTLGQLQSIDSDPQIRTILRQLRSSLRPGGTLVIEVPERDRTVSSLIENEQLGPTAVSRRFDEGSNVLSERFDTSNGTYDLAYALMAKEQVVSELEASGFVIEAIHDEALDPPPTNFMTVVAR